MKIISEKIILNLLLNLDHNFLAVRQAARILSERVFAYHNSLEQGHLSIQVSHLGGGSTQIPSGSENLKLV